MGEHIIHNSELKYKFKQDFEIIQGFVNEFDPCGFINFGAPIDEYDCLTNQLIIAVHNDKSRDEIRDLILHEIEHHFGTPDIETLTEPYKTEFYTDIKILIDKLIQHFERII